MQSWSLLQRACLTVWLLLAAVPAHGMPSLEMAKTEENAFIETTIEADEGSVEAVEKTPLVIRLSTSLESSRPTFLKAEGNWLNVTLSNGDSGGSIADLRITETLDQPISPLPADIDSRSARDLARSSLIPPEQFPLQVPAQGSVFTTDDRLVSQTAPTSTAPTNTTNPPTDPASRLEVKPDIIQNSPVLQRWLRGVPDVLTDIKQDPSFRTRLRLGYSRFPRNRSGWMIGIEDLLVGRTHLTISGDYQATFKDDRQAWGADLRYYLRPLGSYINVAPILGYRSLETDQYTTQGVNLGLRVLLSLSRTGAADIALTQTWVSPGSDEEVGLTTLSFGYALTRQLRLSTEFQRQNARQQKDSRLGIALEWML